MYSVAVISLFPVEWWPFIALIIHKIQVKTMRWQNTQEIAAIPMCVVGPVRIISKEIDEEVGLPLATLESPLWPSTNRGARVCTAAGGIRAVIVDERMTRSVLIEADSVEHLHAAYLDLQQRHDELQQVISANSRFAKLLDMNAQIIGSLMYLRFELLTGDAAGHNMVTLASDNMLEWILQHYPKLRYVSVSGNFCSDKKTSAVNGIRSEEH